MFGDGVTGCREPEGGWQKSCSFTQRKSVLGCRAAVRGRGSASCCACGGRWASSPLQRVLGDVWNTSRTDWLLTGCLTPGQVTNALVRRHGEGDPSCRRVPGLGCCGRSVCHPRRRPTLCGEPAAPSPAGTLGWESFSREACALLQDVT